MILFPSAKINLGLRVIAKREDGFHAIESVFYSVPFSDVVEFRKAPEFGLSVYGKSIPGKLSENLLTKTWKLLHDAYHIPPVEVVLLKNIPSGSGLGGGSSDAAFFLKGLNDFFQLKIRDEKLLALAARLGSDCPFFVRNKPAFVTGRGEIFHTCSLNLSGLYLVLVLPDLQLSTNTLFAGIIPKKSEIPLSEIVKIPVTQWQQLLTNDFEMTVFQDYPMLKEIKEILIDHGALYASMTGTGSAFYGLFNRYPDIERLKRYGETRCFAL